MKKNIGTADRAIRALVAIVIGLFLLTDQITGVAGIVLGVLAVILLGTSMMGFCPLYAPFKISTLKEK